MIIILLSLAGFAVSLYAYIVERNFQQDASYKPACDISDRVSCTRLFSSKYGKLFGISNTLIGMIFYALLAGLALFSFYALIFYLSVAACLASVGLAYIASVKMKIFCFLCTTVYILNIALLIVSYMKLYF